MAESNEMDAATYAKWASFDGAWRDSWWNDDFLALMATRCGLSADAQMLDVGCGAGHWGQRWGRHLPELRLTGVDREEGFLDAARARAAEQGLDARYDVAHGETLPFPWSPARPC